MTEWIDVHDQLPENDVTVLAVKQLKDGRRDVCLARCLLEWEHYDRYTKTYTTMPYWITGGNNNIIAWMPLPDLPPKEVRQ